jgi:hypothetical protein
VQPKAEAKVLFHSAKNISINNKHHNHEIHMQMGENMKKIVIMLAVVAAICICSATATLAGEERERFRFQTINFPNDMFTQLLGINDEEMIAGYHGAATNVGFVFSFRNSFTL